MLDVILARLEERAGLSVNRRPPTEPRLSRRRRGWT